LAKKGITNSFYWSINPESADTYGMFTSPYDPLSNKAGWGTWSSVDSRKVALLSKIWNAPDVPPGTPVIPTKRISDRKSFNCHISSTGLINYTLPKAGQVSLKVYNVNGRLQSELINQQQNAGSYSLNRNQMVPVAGSYLVTFKAGEYSHNQVVYLKN
jgi:hypothetical protein